MSEEYSLVEQQAEMLEALQENMEAMEIEQQAEAIAELGEELSQMSEEQVAQMAEFIQKIETGQVNLAQYMVAEQGVEEQFLPALGALIPKLITIAKPLLVKQGSSLVGKLLKRKAFGKKAHGIVKTITKAMPGMIPAGPAAGGDNYVVFQGRRYKLVPA